MLYCGALAVHVRCDPYKEEVLNRIELLAILTFIFTAWMGVLLSQSEVGDAAKQALSIMIILLNIGALLAMVLAAAREMQLRHTTKKDETADDAVQGRVGDAGDVGDVGIAGEGAAVSLPVEGDAVQVEMVQMRTNPAYEEKLDLEEPGVDAGEGIMDSAIFEDDTDIDAADGDSKGKAPGGLHEAAV